ncbi:DUF6364 family protein [Saccharothrix variisporea]|uniref:CopG family transcriptional regulator n=1 Tax=Saccharothrix variisporea TaxID=543527 RepID=A0A495XFG6_9PSEU|nr:DUF6364 family protein [Saccharothrix variisporea]RKT70298.1 hypothetical protein DFJ66_3555 [Saccharothrix variisporea]
MVKRNITLQLEEEVIQQAKVVAARKNTSVSALLAEQVRVLAAKDERYEQAKKRALDALERPTGRGVVAWTREELYDR